jgi:hypothetical protein
MLPLPNSVRRQSSSSFNSGLGIEQEEGEDKEFVFQEGGLFQTAINTSLAKVDRTENGSRCSNPQSPV